MTASPRRSLFAELKRRQVYRVSVVYAAVAFVVWQVADILVPALGLPDWIMTLVVIGPILTFPFAVVLAWAFELTPDGIRRTSELDAASAPAQADGGPSAARPDEGRSGAALADTMTADAPMPSGRRQPWARLAIGGVALVVFVLGAWWVAAPRIDRSPDLNEVTLAVFPFTIRGNDGLAYLREGVADLLSRNLSGALELQPLDPSLMLKLSGDGEPPDLSAARGIARRAGAGQFVVGSVNEVGGRLRIDATLYALRDSVHTLASKSVQGDTTQLFDLIDQLTAGLLVGRTSGAASERLVRTAAATTTSLSALKAYLEGEQKYRQGEHEDAADAFQRALAEDSTFVLARYRLAISYHMRGEHHAAHRESALVLEDEARLGTHDRRIAHAFHAFHSGAAADAEQQLRGIIRDFPRDLEARVILAELQTAYARGRAEPLAEAKRLLEEVLAADPKFACIYCALALAAEGEGDLETARRMMRLRAGRTTGDTTKMEDRDSLYHAVLRGDTAEMRAAFVRLDTVPNAGVGVMVSRFALAFGHLDFAEEALAHATARGAAQSNLLAYRARIAIERGQWQRAGAYLDSLVHAPGAQIYQRAATLLMLLPFELAMPEQLRTQLLRWDPAVVSGSETAGTQAWTPRLRRASRHYLLGLVASRAGDAVTTRSYADSLMSNAAAIAAGSAAGVETVTAAADDVDVRIIRGLAATVRADLAVRQDQPQVALRELDNVDLAPPPALLAFWISAPTHALNVRIQAHLAAGDYEAALRQLKYGINFGGWPDAGEYAIYQRDMAHTLDALGRTAEAAPYYARFIEAWQDADPALKPQVEAASRRLAALTTER